VTLLTIGYEGRSLDEYLGLLTDAGCTLLCDVRRNAFSHKRGFSKRALAEGCAGAGIRYEHVPELGIASADRQGIESPADVDALFDRYRREMLPGQSAAIARIAGWLRDGEVVALTCFERDPLGCHRHVLADALVAATGAIVTNL
jgi:uncharacterized protein (DUF488 family)